MGFWKMLANLNNADGVREAMRTSYAKHVRVAKSGQCPSDGTTPHQAGLYGALGTRHQAHGRQAVEVMLWAELAPFLALSPNDALDCLCEYVVYQERPSEARVSWLRQTLDRAARSLQSDDQLSVAYLAGVNECPWIEILSPPAKKTLDRRIEIYLERMPEDY